MDTIVEQGPQRAVGIAVVIFVYVLLFEIDGGGSDAVIGLEIDLAGEMRGRVARPSEPEAAVLPQRGGQCDGQPALVPGALGDRLQIGRASCRERVCHYGEISVVAV